MAEQTTGLIMAGSDAGMLAIGAGLAVGLAAIAAGYSQAKIGSAFAATLAERPELKGDMLLYIVIPETILLLGFVISFLILQRL